MGQDLKAVILAHQINELKKVIFGMDLEYASKAAYEMIHQASWQDSAFILNPNASFAANDLLRVQGQALLKMIEFVDLLKKCEDGKTAVKKEKDQRDDIAKMFI